MATFILVHGTFAKSANWPSMRTGIEEAVSAMGGRATFHEIEWSGRNHAAARHAAAADIMRRVEAVRATCADDRIFLIGHSHGGSVIAYFLKEHWEAAKTVSGCAFLSTPFIAMRRRQDSFPLYPAAVFLPLLLVEALWNSLFHIDDYSASFLHRLLSHPTVQWLGLCVLFFAYDWVSGGSATSWVSGGSATSMDKTLREQTADLPDTPEGRYLFLRFSGDEAAAALSAVQCIAWLGLKAARILAFMVGPLFSPKQPGMLSYRSLVKLATLVAYLMVAALAFDLPFWWSMIREVSSHTNGPSITIRILLVAFCVICVGVSALFLAGVFVASLVFLAQALCTYVFGWTDLLTGFFVELAIEPLPFGMHSLIHIDWSAKGSELSGISHSWTYSHPVAIRCLKAWVMALLAEGQAQQAMFEAAAGRLRNSRLAG